MISQGDREFARASAPDSARGTTRARAHHHEDPNQHADERYRGRDTQVGPDPPLVDALAFGCLRQNDRLWVITRQIFDGHVRADTLARERLADPALGAAFVATGVGPADDD